MVKALYKKRYKRKTRKKTYYVTDEFGKPYGSFKTKKAATKRARMLIKHGKRSRFSVTDTKGRIYKHFTKYSFKGAKKRKGYFTT